MYVLRFIYYLQSVLCIVCTMLPLFSRLSILDCSLWLSLTVIVQTKKKQKKQKTDHLEYITADTISNQCMFLIIVFLLTLGFFLCFFLGGGGVPIVFGLSWLPHRFSLRFIYYLQSVLCIVCTLLPLFSRLSILL
jgi:hypothetical protein